MLHSERFDPRNSLSLPPETAISSRQRELLARLEQEVAAIQDSASFRRYLDVQARFHAYSYNNALLILSQRPSATRVASYQTWRTLERQVVRGEPGIKILYPMLKRLVDDDTGELHEQLVGFGIGHVWDVSQTVGKPLPTRSLPELDSRAGLGLLRNLYEVAQQESLVVTNVPAWQLETSLAGFYRRASRQIVIREAAPSQMTVTLAHELAHHFGGDAESYTLPYPPPRGDDGRGSGLRRLRPLRAGYECSVL